MKKYLQKLPILVLSLITFQLYAQYDARRLPEFLDAEMKNMVVHPKLSNIYIPAPRLPDADKINPLPDKMLTNDGFEIVNVSGTNQNQSETWIVVNPMNPNNIVASANDERYNYPGVGYKMGAYWSTNGGKTWTVSTTPSNMNLWIQYPSGGSMTNFDPSLAFNTQGWVYYCFGFCQVLGTQGIDEADNGVFVCRSKDGGITWEPAVPIAMSTEGHTAQPFHDRYLMACDVNPNSPYKDNLYVAWKRFKKQDGIVFSRSTDGGDTWMAAINVPGGSGQTQSPMPAIGPNGEVFLAWQSKNNTYTDAIVSKSTDGGLNFWHAAKVVQTVTPVGTINSQSGRYVLADKQNMRCTSYPAIAVDCSVPPGTQDYNVYVVQAGVIDKTPGLYLAKSTDGGNTWQNKIRIDNNSLNNDIFFPAISVDPKTGLVAIMYYSSQNDPNNKGVDAYLAVSFDKGNSFNIFRITPETWFINDASDVSNQGPGNYYWGDYTSIVAYDGKIYPCFWMPNRPNGNYYQTNTYTALISTNPNAPENFTGTSNSEIPLKITLNWTDPQTNLLGGPLDDFKIVILRGGSQIAEVNKGTQTYIDQNVVDGQEYIYEIYTKLNNGQESAKVSALVKAGGATKPMAPTNVTAIPVEDGVRLTWTNPDKHIDGSFLHDFEKVKIYTFSDGLIKEITKPEIQAGTESSTILNLPLKKFYKIYITAVGKRGEIETESDYSEKVFSYSGAPLTKLEEYFDSEDSVAYYTEHYWARTNKKAYSNPNALTDSPEGNYPNNSETFAILAPITINSKDTTLNFYHIALIDSLNDDHGAVSISDDYGKTWKDLIWVDIRTSSKFKDNLQNSEYDLMQRNLSKYIGKTVYIKFLLYASKFRNNDGWYIDNIVLNDDLFVSVNEQKELISASYLEAYPNPLSSYTNIRLTLPMPAKTSFNIYDALGNSVMRTETKEFDAGEHIINLNMSHLADGIYFCHVSIGGITKTILLNLIK